MERASRDDDSALKFAIFWTADVRMWKMNTREIKVEPKKSQRFCPLNRVLPIEKLPLHRRPLAPKLSLKWEQRVAGFCDRQSKGVHKSLSCFIWFRDNRIKMDLSYLGTLSPKKTILGFSLGPPHLGHGHITKFSTSSGLTATSPSGRMASSGGRWARLWLSSISFSEIDRSFFKTWL